MRLQRRTIGKAMIAIGVVGVLAGIGAVVVGQTLVHQVETSVDDSLVVTTKGLAAVNDSIAATGTIVDTVRQGVASVGTTLITVRQAMDDSSTAIHDTGQFLGGSLPDSIAAVSNVLPTIESVAHSIDSALRTLSKAPFGPNYNPDKPFDQAIADLSTALDPLPTQLRALSKDFTGLDSSTAAISTNLATLGDEITHLQTQLDSVSTLVARYAATAVEASAIAVNSRQDLHDSARSTRLLLIVLGLVFIAGQIVPIWLGTVLLTDESTHRVVARRHHHETDDGPDERAQAWPEPGEQERAETRPGPPMRSPDPGDRMG
jgi:hypothetical protein